MLRVEVLKISVQAVLPVRPVKREDVDAVKLKVSDEEGSCVLPASVGNAYGS